MAIEYSLQRMCVHSREIALVQCTALNEVSYLLQCRDCFCLISNRTTRVIGFVKALMTIGISGNTKFNPIVNNRLYMPKELLAQHRAGATTR